MRTFAVSEACGWSFVPFVPRRGATSSPDNPLTPPRATPYQRYSNSIPSLYQLYGTDRVPQVYPQSAARLTQAYLNRALHLRGVIEVGVGREEGFDKCSKVMGLDNPSCFAKEKCLKVWIFEDLYVFLQRNR